MTPSSGPSQGGLASARLLPASLWLLALLGPLPLLVPSARAQETGESFDAAFDSISEDDLLAHLELLTAPAAEGRDSPSTGLAFAARHLVERLTAAGFSGGGSDGAFLRPFERDLPAPAEDGCRLTATLADGAERSFVLGQDFVPVASTGGAAVGEAVFVGFGIDSSSERYDDVPGDLSDSIAVILEGEPRHERKFEGPEITADADLFTKLATLRETGVQGVLVVRRPPPTPAPRGAKHGRRGGAEPDAPPPEPPAFGFRYTWAEWASDRRSRRSDIDLPVAEITAECASALLGLDVLAAAAAIEDKVKPPKPERSGTVVTLEARTRTDQVSIDNVVGLLPGSDPALADEWVVLGAHYDHLGVDTRGRVALGADDNASGTAALLELADALALARPARSIMICFFAAEEDGLLGSRALVASPPVPTERMVAMLNMDMLGRGTAKEVVVLGTDENPDLDKLLKRAKSLQKSGVTKIVTGQGQDLFPRSDHYPFHEQGVPVLFFFEGLPISKNVDYHTWRDTLDELDLDKLARSTRLVFNTAWLLASEPERPGPPEKD